MGDQRELYLSEETTGEKSPYERLLGDAMKGMAPVYARRCRPGRVGGRRSRFETPSPQPTLPARHVGPKEAEALIAADGSWHNPLTPKARTRISF